MNTALVGRLIVKDWHLTRSSLIATIVGGALAVWLITRGGLLAVMGLSAAFVVLVLVSVLVPIQTIVNERKKQNLPFIMSLPISPADYAASKVLANFSMFGVLWVAITSAVIVMLAAGPAGWIPLAVVSALAPMVAFFLLIAVAMVVESEFWALVTQGACNVSYSFIFMLLLQNDQLRGEAASGAAVWSPLVLAIIGGEIAAMALSLGLTFYLQSRKTHFV
jgi:hypothetical protein